MAKKKRAYKRRRYLIDPKFQLKFSLMMTLIVVVSSAIYPIVFYETMSQIIEKLLSKGLDTEKIIEDFKGSISSFFILWHTLFAISTFIICIFFGHKIAGPIYRIQKNLANIRNGQRWRRLFFRKGDYFFELADDFNQAFEVIHGKEDDDEAINNK